MLVCDPLDSIHISGATVELHRHDGLCALGNRFLDFVRIDQMVAPAVNWNGDSAGMGDRRWRCDHRMRWENHFVAGPKTSRSPCHYQSVGRVPDADCVLHAQVFGEMLLELKEVALLNEGAAMDDIAKDRGVLVLTSREGALVVEKWN